MSFSALQRAENSSIQATARRRARATRVSVLFSEPKIPQLGYYSVSDCKSKDVSVLFSEPKIPQLRLRNRLAIAREGFSALQRAENSSIADVRTILNNVVSFSALQRAENSSMARSLWGYPTLVRFSALQRAENSSIDPYLKVTETNTEVSVLFSEPKIPQSTTRWPLPFARHSFSALQRAENSSI